MKLKWKSTSSLSYKVTCGNFKLFISHYIDSRIDDCPHVARSVYLNNKLFKNGYCHSVDACKKAIYALLEIEIYKMINEAGMNDILNGG